MKHSNLNRLIAGLCVLLAGAGVSGFQNRGGYHLLKRIDLGSPGAGREYFDYIYFDAATRHAYLSHGTDMLVVDVDKGALVGKIAGTQRNHGVALVPELGRGFISDGDAKQVVIFDLKTRNVIGRVPAKEDADSILYDPASKHIFTFEGDANSATVIEPATGAVVANIPLGGKPEQAVADGKGMIYGNLEDKGQVFALDSRTLKITARWPTAPAVQPVSMAMDRQHRRLFIASRDPKIFLVMNADNGKIIGQPFPIGGRVDTNIFDPETGLAACSTGDGTIEIFHEDSPDKFSMAESVKTEYGAKTMALDPKTHNLLVDTVDYEAAAAGAGKGGREPTAKPGTFHLLIYGR